jgi:general secretion pathway protein C
MQFVLKRHFWLVNVLFAGAAMALVARAGNALAESQLSLPPAPASELVRRAEEPPASLNAQWLSKLTGLPLPKMRPDDPPLTELEQSIGPVRTSLKLKLLGTLVAGADEYSVASIQDLGTLKSQTVRIGDPLQTAEVVQIERARVIIRHGQRYEFIDGALGEPAAVARPASNPVALGRTITRTGDNQFRVPRAEIDRILSNLNDVAMQARIVPAFKDGVAQGFKLFAIRPDSLYAMIGIQDGDVIKRINGYDLDSVEKGMELYLKLKEASRIDVELERSGRTVRSTYDVVSR